MLYFCHHCHTQIAADELLPEFTCPSCHSGFVEEMAQSRQNSTVDESSRDTDPMSRRLSSDELSDDNSDVEFLDAYNSSYAQVFDLFQPHQSQMQRQSATTDNESNSAAQSSQSDQGTQNNRINPRPPVRAPRSQFGNRPTVTYSTNNQSLADVLTDFISGVSFGSQFPEGAASNAQPGLPGGSGPMGANRGLINIDFPLPFFLHSNPGDYAWGNAGFDAVITQLLNNLDGSNSGPPPMSEEQLDNLPTITIKDDQVKKTNLQCTVCMDDFQTGDQARQLPCEHFFHEDCIKPWLNIHSSCPICRKTFISDASNTSKPNETQTGANASVTQESNANTDTATTSLTHGGSSVSGSSATGTNQRPGPNYDYTEEECD